MTEVLDYKVPSFVKGHTEWNPKPRVKDGAIAAKCGDKGIVTAPYTGTKKTDETAIATALRVYAKAHGWAEVK